MTRKTAELSKDRKLAQIAGPELPASGPSSTNLCPLESTVVERG